MSMVANILSPRQQMEAKDREEEGGKGKEGAVSSHGDGTATGAGCGGVSLDSQEDGDSPFDQLARETSSLFGISLASRKSRFPRLIHNMPLSSVLHCPHLASSRISKAGSNLSRPALESFAWWNSLRGGLGQISDSSHHSVTIVISSTDFLT